MGSEEQEQKIQLYLPGKGKEEHIAFSKDAVYACSFTLHDTVWEQQGNDLFVTGDDEGILVLHDFFSLSMVGDGYFVLNDEEFLTQDLRSALSFSSDDFVTDFDVILGAPETSKYIPVQTESILHAQLKGHTAPQLFDISKTDETVDAVLPAMALSSPIEDSTVSTMTHSTNVLNASFAPCDTTDEEVVFIVTQLV